MKTMKTGLPIQKKRGGFTLIELLVVIAVMGVLASLSIPVIGSFKKRAIINRTRAEMAQLQTAIDAYKAAYGFYPPGGTNVLVGQLYYELMGTTNLNPGYQVIGDTNTITAATVSSTFGIGGFMNCAKPGAEEGSTQARSFISDFKANQFATINSGGAAVKIIVASIGGPNPGYQPLGQQDVNPWRYNSSSPTNNPGAYDLWVQIVFKPGQTNLVCNWNNRVQVNTSLP